MTVMEQIDILRNAVDDAGEKSEDYAFVISGDLERRLLSEVRGHSYDFNEFINVYARTRLEGIAVVPDRLLQKFFDLL